jgi:isoamylase
VGQWVGDAWREWNGRFRDDVRSFLKGDPGTVGAFASRLFGSPDIYGGDQREPDQSVNFVTCHDGFTLNDLVSYGQKHNLDNGEQNRDGDDDNRSWNCGVEGESGDPQVEALRARQVRNFLTVTLLSAGVPMIGMGDEARRTQRGNNNAYCQDGELSWLDWRLVERQAPLRRFVRTLIGLRHAIDPTADEDGVSLTEFLERAQVEWHGTRAGRPDWSEGSRSLAVAFSAPDGSARIHCIFNAYWETLPFELPPAPAGWRLLVDTGLASPLDAQDWGAALPVEGGLYVAQPRSVVVLGTSG